MSGIEKKLACVIFFQVVVLNEQSRMHPDICQFPSRMFYSGRLTSKTKEFSPFPMERYAVFDLTSTQEEKGRPGCPNSMFNPEEAEGVVKLYKNLSRLLPTKAIGIATPYKAQLECIEDLLRQRNGIMPRNVLVKSIDAFQGDEADIIIMSCVRSQVKAKA